MSEAATSARIFAPYCKGFGIEMGFGHFLTTPTTFGFDMPQSYTKVGEDKQTFQGDMRNLGFLCDESVDYLISCHLLEDATFEELKTVIIPEWRRVLKKGGLLLTNCPDQQKYLEVNLRNGTMDTVNLAHKEDTFALHSWNHHVVANTGPWEVVLEVPEHGEYSFLQILRKV